jgi:cytochrome c oxidase subunit 2
MFNLLCFCDAPELWQINTQDPATAPAEGMNFFHDYLVFFMIAIAIFVFWMLYSSFHHHVTIATKFAHSSILEIVWTIIPAIILIFIAVPSFTLLYSLDELSDPQISLKIVGHQWYWSYEYTEYLNTNQLVDYRFDSYMVPTSELPKGTLRLLEVDNRVILPIKTHIRLLITSADVLHSWAIPSFGIKIDSCPGRLSQGSLFIKRQGLYFGQCSEICGVNHGFMPIVVKGVSWSSFINWLDSKHAF